MKGPLAVGNAWHWHLFFEQLLYRSPPLSLPTATGGSDALLPASCQHPTSISPASHQHPWDCLVLGKHTSQCLITQLLSC